jgi:hypothetical protein
MCAVCAMAKAGMAMPGIFWDDPFNILRFDELIISARKVDIIMDEPDCVDPEKEEFLVQLEVMLERIESHKGMQ